MIELIQQTVMYGMITLSVLGIPLGFGLEMWPRATTVFMLVLLMVCGVLFSIIAASGGSGSASVELAPALGGVFAGMLGQPIGKHMALIVKGER